MTRVLVVMGVSGSGKTTLAARLARHLKCDPLVEGDQFHPAANREKMRSGVPLTDDDRWPWLTGLNAEMRQRAGEYLVVACSALKAAYRKRLMEGLEGRVHFLFLDAPREVLERHHRERVHEYMPASLLESQLTTLERPGSTEPASVVSVVGSEDESFAEILRVLETLGVGNETCR
jgi:gluconokinase